jgi:hypothetical protein
MKKILLLIGLVTIFGCSQNEEPITQNPSTAKNTTLAVESATGHIGDPTKTPDLYIAEFDPASKWQGWDEEVGLRNPPYDDGTFAIYPRMELNYQAALHYSCFIANGAPIDYTGQNDFVVCMPCDGITNEQSAQYQFPGMISIVTFQDGLPIGEVIKQSFWVLPTDWMTGYDYNQQIRWDVTDGLYNQRYMFIAAGTADNYGNHALIKEGKNLIVVEINPDLLITESNYNNNVSTLPVNVGPLTNNQGKALLDLTAIEANKTRPAFNVVVTKNFKGADKYVNLNWDCAYHDGVLLPNGEITKYYVKHHFTVKRNGVVIAENLEPSELKIKEDGRFKSAEYSITIHVTGLGFSPPTTVTVKR